MIAGNRSSRWSATVQPSGLVLCCVGQLYVSDEGGVSRPQLSYSREENKQLDGHAHLALVCAAA